MVQTNLTYKELERLILNFNENAATQGVRKLFSTPSMLSILGVEGRELSHSAFHAWVLGLSAGGSYQPVVELLRLYVRNAKTQNYTYPAEVDALLNDHNFSLAQLEVQTEFATIEKTRVDVLVSAEVQLNGAPRKLNIIIENKVYSHEHTAQTDSYYNHFKSQNPEDLNLFIFLVPLIERDVARLGDTNYQNELRTNKHFVIVTYQHLVDGVLSPLSTSAQLSDRERLQIKEYLKGLVEGTVKDEEINMGVDNDYQKLIDEFWAQNSEIIMKILNAQSSLAKDTETIEMVKSVVANGKDKSKYSVNGAGAFNKIGMAKEAMRIIIEQQLQKGIIIPALIDDINHRWNGACGKKIVLAEHFSKFKDMYSKPEERCRVFEAGGKEFYIDYKWDAYNIAEALSTFKNVFGIIIEKVG
ncbi:MAG: PD-(D/E)XK nuclease family protein [Paludibacteraceae bacterium]|nr:PD-(D/E)XK nuclease family protein [Paludibacteraceae bacterium]